MPSLKDSSQFETLAREAFDVLACLPRHKVIGAWAEHLRIAYKGLVLPSVQTKKLLPKLNTDDIDGHDFSY